jgi:D-glycero-D-manno-heptose 1,7-bisphosphate phosphatase
LGSVGISGICRHFNTFVKRPPAAFLDRDGTLNELVVDPVTGFPESPLRPESVRLVQGVAASLKILRTQGFLLVCVTNQPAAAKGRVPLEQLISVQARVVELLGEEGVHFDAARMCVHHPNGVVEGLSGPCDCRKPRPGMILSAAEELGVELARSWLIGDTDSDVAAGLAAGCHTILLETVGSAHKRQAPEAANERAANLRAAVRIVASTRDND